ncbi:MAG: hypothetical protein HYY46_14685 [Deltaproteobacteria bacterium]|nr:hypothetical protein [Deltaproteobacteria bacterium]
MRKRILPLAFLFLLLPWLLEARVTRIVIDRVESPAFEGKSFGSAGQYEKLVGRAFGEVDPSHPLNAGIVNLKLAPKNPRGKVEYEVEVYILKPVDMSKGNRTILYKVSNRGSKALRFNVGATRSNDPKKAAEAGDGFMMRQGYTIVWSAWQGDILPGAGRLTARFPVASNGDGSPIKKWIRTEFVFQRPAFSIPISFDRESRDVRPYPPVKESVDKAKLFRRSAAHAPAALVPREEWSFGRCPDGKAAVPGDTEICYPAGFSTNYIYELLYEARDPIVMGLGFAATRDVVSFLRSEKSEKNPLVQRKGGASQGDVIRWAIGFGSSQSGRFLKDLIYQGFNQDESRGIVFDGAVPHISASRLTFVNYEFAMPGRFSTALEGHYFPGDQFPFTYETLRDPISGKTDGWLARCRKQEVCPKIMHWDSGTEPWQGRNSLVVTDPAGTKEAPLPENVRLYYFAGTQHGPVEKPGRGICQQLSNPNQYVEMQKALLVRLQAWVTAGKEPPQSRFPSLTDGTLVPALPRAGQGFPAIPGTRYSGKLNDLSINNGDSRQPGHIPGKEYRVFVPKVDNDGNEIGGVRSATLQASLGTYAGWSLRRAGFMEDELCYLQGSFIPFAKTREEREAKGDPRPSLEEKYGSREKYVAAVRDAATRLKQEGFLLEEDELRLIEEAKKKDIGLP